MKILGKILYWAFVIFVIFVIYQMMRSILGGSWQLESIIVVLLGANLGYSFYLTRHIGNVDSKLTKHLGDINSKISEHMGWHKGKENSQ